MPLREYCNPDAILCELEASDKEDAVRQLVAALAAIKAFPKTRANAICDEIIDRERRATTGIGGGIGIPHARSANVKKLSIAIGRIDGGIEFGAVDGERVGVVMLIVSPESSPEEHLSVMRSIVSLVRDPYQCKRLHGCRSPESFLDLIAEIDALAP